MPLLRPLRRVPVLRRALALADREDERWERAVRDGEAPRPQHVDDVQRFAGAVTYAIRYPEETGEQRRPMLRLELASLTGDTTSIIAGIVDSGSDESALPVDLAEELGLGDDDLLRTEVRVPGAAVVRAYRALRPVRARVVVEDVDQYEFELVPLFVPGTIEPLWGRKDFFGAFQVTIDDVAGEVGLTPMIRPRAAWSAEGTAFA